MGSTSVTLDHHTPGQISPTSLTPPSTLATTSGYPSLSRSLSTTSTGSVFSTKTSSTGRESLGSSISYSDTSVFHSSTSSSKSDRKKSFKGTEKSFRRGYVRPQGTSFAASARSRESVLNLGSIAHLQYYFARTGLLDGKGGRRARKGPEQGDLDYSTSDTSAFDIDSSFASNGNSPESPALKGGSCSSTKDEEDEEEFYSSEDDEANQNMLPPTVSTYNQREKYIPSLPTLEGLKEELEKTLSDATKVLDELKLDSTIESHSRLLPEPTSVANNEQPDGGDQHWYELQGLHILDVMTLAIRAAKIYYTVHDQPERLAAIKPERQIRADLLTVMEVLRNIALRNFASGVKTEERISMEQWVASVYEILRQEEVLLEAERSQCASWTWLDENWSGSSAEREWAFMKSMDPEPNSLPYFKSVDELKDDELPTEFLKDLMTGLRLIKIHNIVVRKSKRPFGSINRWHTNFSKPYRCTENLLFWIKAAELRFEVILDVDVTGIVHGADRKAWKDFEAAILTWCSIARREISMGLKF